MADKTITFETEGARRAADDLRDVADASKEAGDGVKDASEKTKGAASNTEKLTARLAKLAAGYAIIKEVVIDGTKEFASQQAALGRLERSFRANNQRVDQYRKSIELARKRSTTLGVSFGEQVDGLSQLVDATGSATTANRDLSLAIDIASQEAIDLSQAVEILRKARNGEVEELKNLNGINKDRAEQLNKIEGSTRRGAKAVRELEKAYRGAAEENKGLEERLIALDESAKNVKASIGNLAAAFIAEDGLIQALGETVGLLKEGEDPLSGWADSMNGLAADVRSLDIKKLALLGPRQLGRTLGILGGEEEAPQPSGAAPSGMGTVFGTEEPLPVPEPKKKKKKTGSTRKRPDGSGAMVLEEADDAEIFGMLAQEEGDQRDQEALAKAREKARERADFMKQMEESNYKERQQAFIDHQKEMERIAEEGAEKRKEDQEKKQEEALELRQAALNAGAQVAQSAANEFIESEAAKAAISATIETARAIAAFATPGGQASGVAHLAAAAQFAIAAAAAGKSPPGGGGKRGSAKGQAAERQRQRDDVGLIGERARNDAEQQAPRPLTVNINSAFPPSPQQAAELASAVERDRRRQV